MSLSWTSSERYGGHVRRLDALDRRQRHAGALVDESSGYRIPGAEEARHAAVGSRSRMRERVDLSMAPIRCSGSPVLRQEETGQQNVHAQQAVARQRTILVASRR